MIRAAPLSLCLALFACATHRESAVQVDAAAQQKEESHAAETVEIHRTEEPSRTVTTIEEYAAAVPIISPSADGRKLPISVPIMVKRTTTVEDRGAVLETATAKGSSESTAASREALSGKGDSEADSKPKLFSLGLGLSAGLILAGVAALLILTRGMWIPFLAKHLFGGSP